MPSHEHQVREAQSGHQESQQALFEAWLPVVLGWCTRLGGRFVDPEDAAQDVMIRTFDRLSSLREPAAFDAWIYGITRRVLAAHRRRVWHRRWSWGPVPERPDPARGPEATASDSEIVELVHRVLEQLPAAQREVVVLCAIEERSTAEVARLLQVPQGTVKSRLRLGRQRFADLAGPAGLDPDPPRLKAVTEERSA